MKQVVTTIFLLLTLVFCTAQEGTKWGVKAGYNYTFAKVNYTNEKQPVAAKHGFGIAGTVKVPFEGMLNFSPYVGYNMKGFIVKPKNGPIKEQNFTLHYIDIAPVLSLDIPAGGNTFVIQGGPILGLTRFGKLKTTTTANVTTSEKIAFGYGGYGWFDLGLTTGMGFHFNKRFIEIIYTPSLTNINNNVETDGINIRNRMFSLNFGYYFK
jgi:hypothetical protein